MKTQIHLFIFFILINLGNLCAQTFEIGGINYLITAADEVRVTVKTGCYSGDIVIPESVEYSDDIYAVTAIGVNAFDGCLSLNSVTLPSSIKEIQSQAFRSAENLTSVNFPSSINSIGNSAFMRCYSLGKVDLSATTITTLGDYAFTQCDSLTSVLLPNTMTSIGDYNFYYCGTLTQVNIPNTVTSLGKRAFSYSGLTSIDIPDSVTTIGVSAFEVCMALATINVPSSVTLISDNAFYGNYSLSTFNIDVSIPLVISSNVFAETPISNAILNVPIGSESAYASASIWQDFGTINSTLGANAFEKNSLKIYPNPVTSEINVLNLKQDTHYTIYNTLGLQVSKNKLLSKQSIHVESLISGVYFLKIRDKEAIKFVKR